MPSTATDRLYGLTTSVAVKAPCKAYTTSVITQSGEQTIGGVACVDGDRYLYDIGTSQAGIWVVREGAHERAKDFDGNRDVVQGTLVGVVDASALTLYQVTTANPITIGTTAIVFASAGIYSVANFSNTSNASLGDALIGVKNVATGGSARTQHDKNADSLHVADFGAAGNGSDDYAGIVNALNASAARGLTVDMDGTKTYSIESELTIPAGARIRTNGAVFSTALTTTGDTYLITIGDDVVIDELIVSIPTGKRRDRCVLLDGDDIRIGKIAISSVDQQANSAGADGALQIMNGSSNYVGYIKVTNWDRAVIIAATTSCTVHRLDVTSYVRGVYLYDNVDLHWYGGKIKTASPNASFTAGHNGVLLQCNSTDAQRGVTIRGVASEDSGEHAWRIGGPERQSNLSIESCSAYNCGGNGLKVLGTDSGAPTARNATIRIDNFLAEDVGKYSGTSALNRCGLLIMYCDDFQITSPIVRARNQATSSQYGIQFDSCVDGIVTSPIVRLANFDGVIFNTDNGDNSNILVNGGEARGCGRHGINVLTAATKTTGRCVVDGMNSVANSNLGFNINNSGTMIDCMFRIKTYGNTNGMGASNDSSTTLQISGAPGSTAISGISARNGSWIDDTTTLNIRKAGSWTAL